METTTKPSLLALPQELRDLVFEYAVTEDLVPATKVTSTSHVRIKRITTGNERWSWQIHYSPQAPHSIHLSLLSCNKQLNHEIRDFLFRTQDPTPAPAKLTLLMQYPNLFPTWDHIPAPPENTSDLDILIKADHMYHPAFMSDGPNNAILKTVFEVVKRYIHRGPHLARPSPLHRPLKLKTVTVMLAPPVPFEEMTLVYGFPAQQLEMLFMEFKRLMRRLCRSGLMFPDVQAFEVGMVGQEGESLFVTSNVWDEEDHTFFQSGGYCWDSGEGVV